MTPVDQLVMRDPDRHIFGDCFRAVLASLLDLPAVEVPHFVQIAADRGGSEGKLIAEWLAPRGLCWLELPFSEGSPLDAVLSLYGGHHSMIGPGPRQCWHAVVGYRGQMVHDPHPSRAGLTLVKKVGLLVRT